MQKLKEDKTPHPSALVIGLGKVGMGYDNNPQRSTYFWTHVKSFSRSDDFELLGGVDPDQDRRLEFEKQYQLPSFQSLADASNLEPDVVVVSVPTIHHGKVVEESINLFNPKIVLCEKPMANNLAEAEKIYTLCKKNSVKLYVNYMRRSDPGIIAVKGLIDPSTTLGPVKGVAWYSKGLLNNGSHLFNVLEYWLGKMLDFSIISNGGSWAGLDPEPDFRVLFERGEVIFLVAKEKAFSHYTLELVAENGRLRYEAISGLIQWQQSVRHPAFEQQRVLSNEVEIIKSGVTVYQQNVVKELSKAINLQEHSLCSGLEGLITMRNIHKILEGVSK